MKFSEPWMVLAVIPVIFLTVLLYIYGMRRKKMLLRRILGNAASDPDAVHVSYGKRFFRLLLLISGLTMLLIAAARPYWNMLRLPGSTPGSDILIIFDVFYKSPFHGQEVKAQRD